MLYQPSEGLYTPVFCDVCDMVDRVPTVWSLVGGLVQGNNSYIFPGVALAVVATKMNRVPNELFYTAARALAAEVCVCARARVRVCVSVAKFRSADRQF